MRPHPSQGGHGHSKRSRAKNDTKSGAKASPSHKKGAKLLGKEAKLDAARGRTHAENVALVEKVLGPEVARKWSKIGPAAAYMPVWARPPGM